jgi:cytochrome c-type biogenesis protein CcmH/NrfF
VTLPRANRRSLLAPLAVLAIAAPIWMSTLAWASAPQAGTAWASEPARASTAVAAHASLTTIEREVMCVTCKIPLNVAESPQASRERALIRGLIAQGHSEAQIKRTLVAEYGPAVLALPSAKGFDLAAYLVPAAAVACLLAVLAALLPAWRRRTRHRQDGSAVPPPLSASDAARLDADMRRFE